MDKDYIQPGYLTVHTLSEASSRIERGANPFGGGDLDEEQSALSDDLWQLNDAINEWLDRYYELVPPEAR